MPGKGNSHMLLQYSATLSGSITVIGYGAILSWASPAIPHLESEKSEILITKDQSSWIASLYSIGFLIGFFLNPFFVDRIGRKWTLILFSIPQIASWALVILAKSHITLYIARIIGGTGYGGGLCAMTVYISEIGNKNNRGIFLVLIRLSMGIGILLTMVLGAFFTYKQMNFILLMLPITFLVLFLFMPDSSYFREINERLEGEEMRRMNCLEFEEKETEESCTLNVVKEKSKLKLSIPETKSSKLDPKNIFNPKESNFWKLIGDLKNRKALAIVICTGLINTFSGQSALGSYGQKILDNKGAVMDPKKAMVLLSLLNVFACLVSTLIVERVRRRTLLLFSGMTCSLSLGIVGIFFCLEKNQYDVTCIGWIPIFWLSIYDLLISTGPSNIFYIYQGELFTNDVKSVGVTIVKCLYIGFGFISVLEFQTMVDFSGIDWVFWIFSICCAFGTIAVYFMAPETKGKTFEEIQESLERKKFFHGIQDLWSGRRKSDLV